MSHGTAKRVLRAELLSRLRLLDFGSSPWIRDRLAAQITLFVSRHPGVWGSYMSLPFEADPNVGAIPGVEWVYPRLEGRELSFRRTDVFVQGPMGLREPPAEAPVVPLADMTGLLVPGVAFDRGGGRLGRGKGFFDRTLADFTGLKVGIGFSAQVVNRVPVDSWDVGMNYVLTEQTVHEARSAGKGTHRWKW